MAIITKELFLKRFSDAVWRGNAALFVGAGLSVGAGFVDWRELLRDIAADLELDIDEENDLIALAQYEFNSHTGRNRLNETIIREFKKRAELSPSHRWMARLPIDTIWTTNYDTLIENALDDAAKVVDVKHRQRQIHQREPYADVTLLKMHGDVSDPDEAVLIKDDYERYESQRGLFSERLRGDLASRHFLFLGFSFTDPNIDYILSRLRVMLWDTSDSQPPRYCILKSLPAPDLIDPSKRKAQKREISRQQHRVRDLERFHINVVLIDEYAEIEWLLEQLVRRVAARHILISGTAASYDPLGREKMENFCRLLGSEIIKQDYSLVSGFGLGIAGSCILGAFEQSRRERTRRVGGRLRIHPFPQNIADATERARLYADIRRELVAESGVTIFISGNKLDIGSGNIVIADGVLQEFELARDRGHFLIPVPCTGGAARHIWEQMQPALDRYYPQLEVRAEFAVLCNPDAAERVWIEAIFSILHKVNHNTGAT